MFHDAFGTKLSSAPTRWIEPPWKAILSNKGILPLLWEMFPNHPNLLPAYFEDDPKAAKLGSSFVRKPLYSREGANVALVSAGTTLMEQQGPYGAEGIHPAGDRAAAEFLRSIRGARKLAGRSHAMRPVDPRGREPDHRQHVTLPAARDIVAQHAGKRGEDQDQRAAATARSVCGTRVDAPARITGAMFGR